MALVSLCFSKMKILIGSRVMGSCQVSRVLRECGKSLVGMPCSIFADKFFLLFLVVGSRILLRNCCRILWVFFFVRINFDRLGVKFGFEVDHSFTGDSGLHPTDDISVVNGVQKGVGRVPVSTPRS